MSNTKKILKFSATWCQPCKQLSKTIESTDLGVLVEEIDIDEENNAELVAKYNIRSVPTLILLEGENVIGQLIGSATSTKLQMFVHQC